MLSDLLFLTVALISLTLVLSSRVRHPFTKALLSVCMATAVCLPILVDVRLVALPAVLLVAVLVLTRRKWVASLAVPALVCCAVLCFYPDAQNQLYLQARYSDTFVHLHDDVYYAECVDADVIVSRRYGDTYQSALYESTIKTIVGHCFPQDTVIYELTVEPVQTIRLFIDYNDYVDTVMPRVHVTAKIPETKELDYTRLPFNTTVLLLE